MEKINIIKKLITNKEQTDNNNTNWFKQITSYISNIVYDKNFQEYIENLFIEANNKKIENIDNYYHSQLVKTDITKKLYPMKKNIFIQVFLVKEEVLGSPKKYQEMLEKFNFDTQGIEENHTITDSIVMSLFSIIPKIGNPNRDKYRSNGIFPFIKISIANYNFASTDYDDYNKVIKSVFNID